MVSRRAFVAAVSAGWLLPLGSVGAAGAAVSDTIPFDYDGKNVRVKIYSYNSGDAKDHPVFKYSDLLNRAIKYKRAHPDADVHVKCAMYEVGRDVYVGFDPEDASYGFVKGYDHGGDHSEKLVYSLVKAAKYEVEVDFVFHLNYSGDTLDHISGFLEDPTGTDPSKKAGDYLRIKQVSWGTASAEQMHCTYLTVSHYLGDTGAVFTDTTYITTGNLNDHDDNGTSLPSDLVNSGVLINAHPELMESYNRYFDLVFQYADDQAGFQNAVRARHAEGGLNYDDRHFSSYFTPIPSGSSDGWDTRFNPVAKYVDEMAGVSGDRYLKVNMYHLKADAFGQRFHEELSKIYNSSGPGLKHFRFVVRRNTSEEEFPLDEFNKIGIVKHDDVHTHAKNVQFALSGVSRYYSLTGSTNLKLDGNVSKANAHLVIKEFTTDHPVYNAFKEIFQYLY